MGGKAPKQKVSSSETDQSNAAVSKWNERVTGGYLGLEKDGVADSKRDHTGFIVGRSSADLAQEEAKGLRGVNAAGGKQRDFNKFGTDVASSLATGATDAAKAGQTLRDTRMVGSMKVGQDVSLTAGSGLRTAAIVGNTNASAKLQNSVLKSNAKFSAITEAAGGAMTGATLRADGFRLTNKGLQKTNEVGLLGKGLGKDDLEASLKQKSNTLGWTAIGSQL